MIKNRLEVSGGVQEEAPSLSKPVLVMRDTTERPEALEAGTVKLVGTNRELIIKEAQELISNKKSLTKKCQRHTTLMGMVKLVKKSLTILRIRIEKK